MAVTRQEIAEWFDRGVRTNKRYMVIVCDTFSYEDYPCFFETADEAKRKIKNPGDMQRVMESYDLKADKETQLNMTRCHAL